MFQDESSVQALIDACIEEDGKLYLCVSSPTIKDKPVCDFDIYEVYKIMCISIIHILEKHVYPWFFSQEEQDLFFLSP